MDREPAAAAADRRDHPTEESRIETFAPSAIRKDPDTGGRCQGLYFPDGVSGFGGHKRRPSSCTINTAVLPAFRS